MNTQPTLNTNPAYNAQPTSNPASNPQPASNPASNPQPTSNPASNAQPTSNPASNAQPTFDGPDESRFPPDFLDVYEPLELLSSKIWTETNADEKLLVKHKATSRLCVAECTYDQTRIPKEHAVLKALDHPGLPKYIDEFKSETALCAIREYIPGVPLNRFLETHRQMDAQSRTALCLSFALQLCEILQFLHGQTPPILHRDIKPQNLIISPDGKLTLIDFGIARMVDQTKSSDTLCYGTRGFASPEQYGFAQTDPRSDLFSVGILLCWMLTG